MNKTGINMLPLVPMRAADSELSEMTSQLLFGERVDVLEVRERWLHVRNMSDNYTGWCDRKMIHMLHDAGARDYTADNSCRVIVPFIVCDKTNQVETMFLPGGSVLPLPVDNEFVIAGLAFRLRSAGDIRHINPQSSAIGAEIVRLAEQYLNAPYLWGGKTMFGIDCSGLVQVVFSMAGLSLPRDASQQVERGRVIDFLSEAQSGDLAFFENNEGNIIHVGILVDSHKIIHASGWVKVETIDSQGIISAENGNYSHKLRVIKRLI